MFTPFLLPASNINIQHRVDLVGPSPEPGLCRQDLVSVLTLSVARIRGLAPCGDVRTGQCGQIECCHRPSSGTKRGVHPSLSTKRWVVSGFYCPRASARVWYCDSHFSSSNWYVHRTLFIELERNCQKPKLRKRKARFLQTLSSVILLHFFFGFSLVREVESLNLTLTPRNFDVAYHLSLFHILCMFSIFVSGFIEYLITSFCQVCGIHHYSISSDQNTICCRRLKKKFKLSFFWCESMCEYGPNLQSNWINCSRCSLFISQGL